MDFFVPASGSKIGQRIADRRVKLNVCQKLLASVCEVGPNHADIEGKEGTASSSSRKIQPLQSWQLSSTIMMCDAQLGPHAGGLLALGVGQVVGVVSACKVGQGVCGSWRQRSCSAGNVHLRMGYSFLDIALEHSCQMKAGCQVCKHFQRVTVPRKPFGCSAALS